MKHSELCSDSYFAFVNGIALPDGNDSGAGTDGVHSAERGHSGDTEIGGRVGSHFFYAYDLDRNLFARLHRGRFDIQAVVEADVPLVYISKSGVGVKKAAEENE